MAIKKRFDFKFVGRQNIMKDLENRVDKTLDGNGQLILISGEAGSGKTRLTQELAQYAISKNMRCLEGSCIYRDISYPYLPFITALSDISSPSLVDDSKNYVTVEEAFLISDFGNVVSYASREGGNVIDEDIVGGMLAAVESFVKDAFGDGGGTAKGLETLVYGTTRILIEHGKFVFLAVVLSGVEPAGFREELRKLVARLEDEYQHILKDWDGDLDNVKDITKHISNLATKRYKINRSIKDIDIKMEKDRVFERVLQWIIEAANTDPVLLILEDMHWADISSIQLLQYIARNTLDSRVLICGTYRPEELNDLQDKKIHPLKEMIMSMSRYKMSETIELENLLPADVSEMIKSIFGIQKIPESFIERLYKETEGNPFFIDEMLNSFQDEDIIKFSDGNWQIKEVSQITIPPTIKDLISLRMDRLDEQTLNITKHASVIGLEFEFNVLELATEINEEKLINILDKLVAKKILQVDMEDDELYRFNHAMIREVVYSSLGGHRKRMIHERVAKAIEEINKDHIGKVLYQLSYHYSNTKDHEKALFYSISAGECASSEFALEEAFGYYRIAENAIDKLPRNLENQKKKLAITTHLGDISQVMGMLDSALEYYDIVKVLSNEIKDENSKAKSFRNIGLIHLRRNEWEEAMKNLEIALEISEGIADYHGLAETYYNLGTEYERTGDFEIAIKNYTNCIKNASSITDNKCISKGHLGIGRVYAQKGKYKDSIDSFKKAVDVIIEEGEIEELARIYANIGATYNFIDVSKAIKYHEKAIKYADKTGNIRMKGYAFMNMAHSMIIKTTDLNKASKYLDKALIIFKKLDEKMTISATYSNYGSIFKLQKEWEKAGEYFEKAIDICKDLDTPYYLGNVLFEYGLMYKDKGDSSLARNKFESCLKIFKNLQNSEMVEKIKKEMEY